MSTVKLFDAAFDIIYELMTIDHFKSKFWLATAVQTQLA